MQITKLKMPESKYSIKCPYFMEPEGITVHNTYNDASAMAEASYMTGNDKKVSFHEVVDDYRVVHCIDFNRNSFNAGDGRNGFGNRKTIAMEICYSKSGGEKFDLAEKNATKRIAQILKERNWGIEKVGKHQDRSGKYCPHRTLDLGWERFLNMIREELGQTVDNTVTNASNSHEIQNADIFHDGKINCVYDIQEWLNNKYGFNIAKDNKVGPETRSALVKALQTELNIQFNKGLVVDGVFGSKTKQACINVRKGSQGNITMLIQCALFIKGYNITMNKVFDNTMENIVRQFQADNGLSVDGIVGRNTFEKLFK